MKTVDTNFDSEVQGQTSDPNKYNNNLAKIEEYLNDVYSYLGEFMANLGGDGIGVVSGGMIETGVGLTVEAEACTAWVGGETIYAIAATVTIPLNSTKYVYLNADGEYEVSSTFGYYSTKIPRAKVVTNATVVTALTVYNNQVFTMEEMALSRITPVGLSFVQSGGNTIINVSYLDPSKTGLESILIEGSVDGGDTWTTITTVTP